MTNYTCLLIGRYNILPRHARQLSVNGHVGKLNARSRQRDNTPSLENILPENQRPKDL